MTKKADYLYQVAKEEEAEMERAELDRLLYVGMTRAQDHLLFSGFMREKEGESSFLASILREMEGCIASDVWKQHRTRVNFSLATVPSRPLPTLLSPPSIQVVPIAVLDYPPSLVMPPVVGRQVSVSDLADLPVGGSDVSVGSDTPEQGLLFSFDDVETSTSDSQPLVRLDAILHKEKREAQFGTLCHELLEQSEKNSLPKITQLEDFPQTLLAFEKKNRAFIADVALTLVRNYLESEDSKSLKSPDLISRRAEFEFLMKSDGEDFDYIRGRADLVLEYADRVLIIDYKTDQFFGEGGYERQMSAYREAFEAITGKRAEVRLVFLRRYWG